MGGRRDKGLALTRYLTGHTGIPLLSWDGGHGRVAAPPPYQFRVTTGRKLQLWTDSIREPIAGSMDFSIRYEYSMPSIDQAWVGMKMQTFVPLLTAHYESIRDRVQTYKEGD